MDKMITKYSGPSKGIFWFICRFDDFDEKADLSDIEILALPIPCDQDGMCSSIKSFNSRRGDSFVHKKTWRSLVADKKELRIYPWDYFPRGRVDIRKGRADIYINPLIAECPGFDLLIKQRFDLGSIKTKIHLDTSIHYHCHWDDPSIGGMYLR